MTHRALDFAANVLQQALLRTASLLVPSPQRPDWLREWLGELWHVRAACLALGGFSAPAQAEVTAFCMGAFRDAVCLRRHQWKHNNSSVSVHGSAHQCLLSLGAIAALCAFVAYLLPGVHNEREATRTPMPAALVLIGQPSGRETQRQSVTPAQYRYWRSHRQAFFSHLAFYRTEQIHAALPGIAHLRWTIAHTSADLLPMLGVSLANPDAHSDPFRPQAVLSQAAWRNWFHSDPDVVGAVVSLGARKIQIAGILPSATWQLPGAPDLLFLDSDTTLARSTQKGFILASLAPENIAMSGQSFVVNASAPDGSDIFLRGDPIDRPSSGPIAIYLFALLLAVLALPAITSVSSSETHFASHQPALRARLNRWSLLAGKISLIAVIAWFGALDIAYAAFPDFSTTAEFLQFGTAFCISLFGLRWAINDQSQRCPVCLRHVTHPAQVGIASQTFLGWNGTEMICMGGHALLHVPSLPTSWFSHQRWTYLDTSWDFLFADTTLHP